MRPDAPRVSVVVRSFSEERFIRRLFLGLKQQTFKDFEVVLVDSGSTDNTVAIAESFAARIVHIARSEFSFGRSLNRGCAAAKGEILVFVSAHVYPTQIDWLENLIRPFADPAVALVYGKQRGNEITKFSERNIFVKWFPDQSDANQKHHFCNNANCAVRHSIWETFRYDESLTGLEDLAFAKEVQRRGGSIAYRADAEIIHVHDETWGRVRNRYRREAIALRQIEPSLGFSFLDFLRLTGANIATDLAVARRQKRLRREIGSIVLFRFNQFWGTYLGHRKAGAVTAELKNRFYFPPAAPAAIGKDMPPPAIPGPTEPSAVINYKTLETSPT
jgi:glycosyltransferase involved in cell wall biosynthesis